jgi:hypothetical protein
VQHHNHTADLVGGNASVTLQAWTGGAPAIRRSFVHRQAVTKADDRFRRSVTFGRRPLWRHLMCVDAVRASQGPGSVLDVVSKRRDDLLTVHFCWEGS